MVFGITGCIFFMYVLNKIIKNTRLEKWEFIKYSTIFTISYLVIMKSIISTFFV